VVCNSPQPKQCPKCEGILLPTAGALGCLAGITASSGGVVEG
jgi:hypothetical protein